MTVRVGCAVAALSASLLLGGSFAGLGCASGPSEESSGGQASTEANEDDEATSRPFGDDAMGAARRWTAELPDSAPERFRDRTSNWSDPVVARLRRRDSETYRAVVLPEDDGEAEGLLITLERSEGSWRVDGVERVGGSHGWTTY